MKHRKLFSLLAAAALVAAMSVPAFAAEYAGPADACAGVTGQSAETIQSERQAGKTYGQIASDYGKLPEFKEAMLEIREDVLNKMVEAGRITKEQAEKALETARERREICDGSGQQGLGQGQGPCNGQGLGGGQGSGSGRGSGNGQGRGNSMRLRDGSCY